MTPPDVPGFEVPVALYAGSFDPITHGHEDLITRSLAFAGRLVVYPLILLIYFFIPTPETGGHVCQFHHLTIK